MRKILLFLTSVLICLMAEAQTATTIASGNWISPATWQGGVVPTPGYDVIINHNVTLGTSWGYSSGSITINQSGSLSQSVSGLGMLVSNTGSFVNHGTFSFSKLALVDCLPVTNNGVYQGIDSLYVKADFNNYGTINAYDFMTLNSFINYSVISTTNLLNTGSLLNYYSGTINTVNTYNDGNFTNKGLLLFNDFTNAENFVNTNSMTCSGNLHNKGYFLIDIGAGVTVSIDFSNNDSIYHDANIVNNGQFIVHQNLTNADTLAGEYTGQYCIGNGTTNTGFMFGEYDFCDLTPPATAPFIDYNTGIICPAITWCTSPCGTGINNNKPTPAFQIYPNPAADFTITNPFFESAIFTICLADGRLIKEIHLLPGASVNINDLPDGLYLYRFCSSRIFQGKLIRQ